MPAFSQNEINEAKRRVEDMRRRSRNYTEERPHEPPPPPPPAKPEIEQKPSAQPLLSGGFLNGLLGGVFENEDTPIILLLILILRKEHADNSLILALLYILL